MGSNGGLTPQGATYLSEIITGDGELHYFLNRGQYAELTRVVFSGTLGQLISVIFHINFSPSISGSELFPVQTQCMQK